MAKENILIIEDELTLINNISDKLRAEGYNVSTAMDGELGWDKIRAEKPDLLILDIMLPGLDGLSLTRMVKAHSDPAINRVRIIMLTARSTEVDKIIGLESGA